MGLTLEYVNDARVFVAQQWFHENATWFHAKRSHYAVTMTWIVVLVAAAFAALQAGFIVLMFCFILILIVRVVQSFPYSRLQRRAIEAAAKAMSEKHIRLLVDEHGLHETVDDIYSFAPWSAVRSFILFQDVLFIELKARLWALIPRYGLKESSASVEELIEMLRARGVVERGKT